MTVAPAALDAARATAARAAVREPVLAFCRDLVRIPSPSGDEERAAARVAEEMRRLGFDHVEIDPSGNAIGILEADAVDRLPGAVLLDAHLDHVDAGDAAAWSHPPFDGDVSEGRLWGRGATDTKSSVAAQVHAVALLREAGASWGLTRRRDMVVAAVVQEEVGGLGTAGLLASGLRFSAALVGEPSEGALAFAHRGRVELEVSFHGRAAHASRPDWGVNPHASLARFVLALGDLAHERHPDLGLSSVAPTLVSATPQSPNVIPARVTLTLDWRHVPSERPEEVALRVAELASRHAEPGVRAEVTIPTVELRSWSGWTRSMRRVSNAFGTEPGAPHVGACMGALEAALGRRPAVMTWDFASDAGWLAGAGIPCAGYGPGDVRAMHVADESVSVELLAEAVVGNASMAIALASLEDAP